MFDSLKARFRRRIYYLESSLHTTTQPKNPHVSIQDEWQGMSSVGASTQPRPMGQDRSIDGHLPPIEPIPFSGKPTAPVDVPRATTPETSPEWGIAEWPSSTKLSPARFVRSEHEGNWTPVPEPAAIAPPPPPPVEWNLGQDDPHDHYPWTWTPYLDEDGGPNIGSISTPNGPRESGLMHTYWGVSYQVWEPQGQLICRLVNEWAHKEFGTPLPGPVHPEGEEL